MHDGGLYGKAHYRIRWEFLSYRLQPGPSSIPKPVGSVRCALTSIPLSYSYTLNCFFFLPHNLYFYQQH